MQEIYTEPIKAELITERIKQVRDAGVTVAGSLSPQRTKEFAKTVVDAGVDMFVIRGTTVSAEHVSAQAEPLNLKEFIYELDVPVIVGGCATYQAALHLMRTGAAGVLVGFGGGAAHTTRTVLGVAVPMASAVADVAAARRDYMDESGGRYVHVIADGSIGRSGDIAKAVACGADAVMIGSPFARATDAPRPGLPLGRRGAPRRPAARRAGAVRHRRHARGDPVRALASRRRHHEPDRCAAPGDGDDGLHRAQGVPAHRGRRPVGSTRVRSRHVRSTGRHGLQESAAAVPTAEDGDRDDPRPLTHEALDDSAAQTVDHRPAAVLLRPRRRPRLRHLRPHRPGRRRVGGAFWVAFAVGVTVAAFTGLAYAELAPSTRRRPAPRSTSTRPSRTGRSRS